MIRGSCAAEGITDGRNGYLIEENAESLTECLLALWNKRDVMHRAGELANQEIYISWETAVHAAMERYEIVIDRYKSGLYPSRREPMDVLLKANGELMEDLGHLMALRREMRHHFEP